MPLPRKFMNFSSENGVIWCILGVLFLTFMCPMDCSCMHSEVPLKGKKYNTCRNIGGRQHRTAPAGQILGVATPATPAALTPMCSCTHCRVLRSGIPHTSRYIGEVTNAHGSSALYCYIPKPDAVLYRKRRRGESWSYN